MFMFFEYSGLASHHWRHLLLPPTRILVICASVHLSIVSERTKLRGGR